MSYQYSIYALPNWTMRANRVSVASPSLEFVVQFLQPQLVFAYLVIPYTPPRCADVIRFVYWAYFFLHHFRQTCWQSLVLNQPHVVTNWMSRSCCCCCCMQLSSASVGPRRTTVSYITPNARRKRRLFSHSDLPGCPGCTMNVVIER